jgi:hypothetical protein
VSAWRWRFADRRLRGDDRREAYRHSYREHGIQRPHDVSLLYLQAENGIEPQNVR